ncbi:unnamed protein product [Camellia sinensis]
MATKWEEEAFAPDEFHHLQTTTSHHHNHPPPPPLLPPPSQPLHFPLSRQKTTLPLFSSSPIPLSMLSFCIGLGIKSSIVAGIDGSGFGHQRSLLTKFVFLMGLHETMQYWWRRVVTPVVDDTVFGYLKEERWVERVAVAVNFGSLLWWRLRDEVSHLVVVAEVKKEMAMGVGVAEFVGWRLCHVNVTIGMVKSNKMRWLTDKKEKKSLGELEQEFLQALQKT